VVDSCYKSWRIIRFNVYLIYGNYRISQTIFQCYLSSINLYLESLIRFTVANRGTSRNYTAKTMFNFTNIIKKMFDVEKLKVYYFVL